MNPRKVNDKVNQLEPELEPKSADFQLLVSNTQVKVLELGDRVVVCMWRTAGKNSSRLFKA